MTRRQHPLSDACAKHWNSRAPGCIDCERATEAATFWIKCERAIGARLRPDHRVAIARILDGPGASDERGPNLRGQAGRTPRYAADDVIRSLAVVFRSATGSAPRAAIKNADGAERLDALQPKAGFAALLLAVRSRLPAEVTLQSDVQFVRRAREVLSGRRAADRAAPRKLKMIELKNVSAVTLMGRAASDVFSVASKDGEPVDLYWRRRIAERGVVIVRSDKIRKVRLKSARY